MTSILGYPRKSESDQSKTKKVVAREVEALFPTGSTYLTVVNSNPATLLGFGSWASIGSGTVLVGGIATTKTVYWWERTS